MIKPPDIPDRDLATPVTSCESLIQDCDVAGDRHPVDVLADEFSARCRAGESPSIEEYERRAPEHGSLIRSLFPTIAMIERMTRNSYGRSRQSPKSLPEQTVIGDFQIVREIGRGGMGIVYEAIQRSLQRKVALKVLGSGISNSPSQLQRFRREAESAARLHHTNIVPVFGIGDEGEFHFYAMQFIDGVPLADAIETARHRPSGDDTSTDNQATSLSGHTKVIGASPLESSSADIRGAASVDRTVLMPIATEENVSRQISIAPSDAPSDGIGPTENRGPVKDSENSDAGRDSESDHPTGASATSSALAREGFSSPIFSATERDLFQKRNSLGFFRHIANLAAQIADALDYAHRHGVLHRDVKPSNLMLDESGGVWIMDFGLVKVLARDDITQVGEIVGTLRYMAPEQLEGRADARTDVYGLGLTLFELLTLRPAFDGDEQITLAQRLQKGDVPRPRSINPSIPRDLETIVLKATSREPGLRYADAAKFAEDLKRFRDDRPILARRITVWERLWRWSRRNPALAGAIGSIIVLLGVVASVATMGRIRVESALLDAKNAQRRSEANLDSAIDAFDSILDNVTSRGLPRSLAFNIPQEEVGLTQTPLSTADALLLNRLLEFYRTFAGQNADNQQLRLRIARAHQRAGSILVRLGRLTEAEEDLRTAVALQKAILKNDPLDVEALVSAAAIYNEIGELLLRRGEFRETFNSHLEARALLLDAPESLRSEPMVRFELARSTDLFASIDIRSGTNEGPVAPPEHGRRMDHPPRDSAYGPTRRPPPHSQEPRDGTYRAYGVPATGEADLSPPAVKPEHPGTEKSDDRLRRAKPKAFVENPNPMVGLSIVLREASDEFRSLVDQFPTNAEYQFRLAQCLRHRLVHAASSNDEAVARETFHEAVQILDQLAVRFPNDPRYLFELGDTLTQALRAQSSDEAIKSLERAVEISEQLSTRFPTASEYQLLLGTSLARRASVEAISSQPESAESSLKRSIDVLKLQADQFPDQGIIQIPLAKSCQQLGDLLRTTSAIAVDQEPANATTNQEQLVMVRQQRLERSRRLLESAIERFANYLSTATVKTNERQMKGHFNAQTLSNLYASLAETLSDLQLPDEAAKARRNAVPPRRPGPPRR